MIGFAVSTAAVILAAWFGYVAGRAGRPRVFTRANLYAGVMHQNVVPAGTCATRCHPADCDDTCPRYSQPYTGDSPLLDRTHRAIGDATGWLSNGHVGHCD